MKNFLLISLLLQSLFVFGQDQYPVSAIPDSLKRAAHAVVRYEQTNFIQKDLNNATEEVVRVVTVLDEKGRDEADLDIFQDQFRELKNFSGEIYLSTGKLFKKLSKGDLATTALSSELASDDIWTYYQCTSPSYPFTVRYSYEIRWKNGIAGYPSFSPSSFSTAVEKAGYRLEFPASESIRCKSNSFMPPPEKSVLNKDSIYTWKCENIPAIAWEPFAPSLYALTPALSVSPNNFCFGGCCGKMDNWQGVGLFLSQLQDKRDILSPLTVEKIKELTKGITDDKEKTKKLYEYLQSSTRYVSIQLGIGGFQTIPASQVAQTGYGDCKALSNYMKAMLSVVNIPSYYTIVNTKKKTMFPDFSSMTQANHVILMVPLENDTIWLECTNRDVPFNYAHSNIAGHDVLVVDGGKSKLLKVREMPDSLNRQSNSFHLQMMPDATAHSSIRSIYKNQTMESMLNFALNMPEKDKINRLSEGLSIQKSKISNIQTAYIKSEYPEVIVNYTLDAERYANQTGSRMFIPVNPFTKNMDKSFSSSSRKLDIRIENPFIVTDSISIDIPEGYLIETKPSSMDIQAFCGSYSSQVEEKGTQLLVVQKIDIPRGNYPAFSYSEMKDFFKKVSSSLRSQLVLKKKE